MPSSASLASAVCAPSLHDALPISKLRVNGKKQALQELAKRAATITHLPDRQIFDVILERERLGTTGVGGGIAIPHGRLPKLDHIYRSEEHTSELQSQFHLVCRLLPPSPPLSALLPYTTLFRSPSCASTARSRRCRNWPSARPRSRICPTGRSSM